MFLVSVLMLAAWLRVSAQVTVEVALDQEQFLPNESLRVAVKITNLSGRILHLGADPGWLTFSVEGERGFVVAKNGDVPVVDAFDVESSMRATKHVDLQPYYALTKPGHYKITATIRIKDWPQSVASPAKDFDIVRGAEVWSQDFGVVIATNAPPEARKFTLVEANYLREQLRLYLQLTSTDGAQIFKVTALGPMVSFSAPETQFDRSSQLHVLWQTGAQSFSYVVISPDGVVFSRDVYDNFYSRPRLTVNGGGEISVQGGTRRGKPSPLPSKLPLVTNPASGQL